jgi:transposase
MSKPSMICAGIDTGKRKLDVALNGARKEQLQTTNDTEGHAALVAWLRRHRVKRVGIEASGGYEQAVVGKLRSASFVVIVFQPKQVRAYATFVLQRAKNDKIDAGLIAACTAVAQKVHPAPDARLAPLCQQLTLIEQLGEDIARHKNRRESCRDRRQREFWGAEIKRLKGLMKRELAALVARIRQHDDLAAKLDLVESINGIGLRTAVAILLRMPELGRISREHAAALAGLAPYDDDSGEHVGIRHIEGGRVRLRNSLYAAALPAAFRWNPQLIALYGRLRSAGKGHKVALVACARKLLIYANTVVERASPWVARPPAARAA